MSDLFGPLVTTEGVRMGIEAHLKEHQETYLAWAERQTGRDPRALPLIKGWEKPNDLRKWPETQLPALLIIVRSSGEAPRMQGDGTYSVLFLVEISAVASASNEQATRDLAGVYASAFAGAMLQLPSLSDLASATDWRSMATNQIPDDAGRSLAAEGNLFGVTVEGVLNANAGLGPDLLADPDFDPYDPPQFPAITDTDLEVSKP